MTSAPSILILVVGPTAVGKTELSLKLAKKFKTEILSCDSRQFYKELILGTAKPTAAEQEEVPHHFIDTLSIAQSYDVRKYEEEALSLLESLFATHQVVVMTGGTGLFADAVQYGLDDMPEVSPDIRQQLIQELEQKGLEWIQAEIARVDPEYFAQVDRQNPQRLLRALEIYRGTGLKFSSFRTKKVAQRPFRVVKIGLQLPREELYARIDLRMEEMLTQGLEQEATLLFEKRHLNALQTVGYTEIFGYLKGDYDREEAVRLLKRNSRRYAKRQLTWFKKDGELAWFHPREYGEILDYLEAQIALKPPNAATQL